MRALVVLAFCMVVGMAAGSASGRGPADAGHIKEWRFPVQRGEVRAQLDHGPADRFTLSFERPACSPCVSMAEFAGMLSEVLQEMPRLGLQPAKLAMVRMGVEDPEMRRALEDAAMRSPVWRKCERTPGCGGNGVVVQLLNEISAFGSFDNVVRGYGLSAKVGSAENISVVRAGKVPGLMLPAGTNRALRLPDDADLEILMESAAK